MKILIVGSLGFVFGFAVIYLGWCLIARRIIKINIKKLLYYMGLAFPFCLILEVGFGHLHHLLFNEYLWQYRVLPVHDGLTSLLNFAIWPLYGLHFYLYDILEKSWKLPPFWKNTAYILKLALSGPLLEFLLNMVCQLTFNRYYFYYYPDDLFHYTSIQVIPYYFVASYAFAKTIKYIENFPVKAYLPIVSYLSGLVFLFLG